MTQGRSEDPLAITFGVEEEFFLIDPDTRDLLPDPDRRIFEDCEKNRGPHKVVAEFLRSQIEATTRVCQSVAEVREALVETRRFVINAAVNHDGAVLAASTHPFAAWHNQVVTAGRRYEQFAMTYQQAVRELLVGGMHIHAGFGDADSRVRVMTALRQHLPLLHALSASSPFSSGRETGFKSNRITLFSSLPRTGLPGPLCTWDEFDRLVAENCWLAQRYGVLAFLGNTGGEGRTDIDELAHALVDELTEDARALGCEAELRHTLDVIRFGTGADRQIDHFRLRQLEGDSEPDRPAHPFAPERRGEYTSHPLQDLAAT